MTRALIAILDSAGIGGAPDAARYADEGADTIGHIAEAAQWGAADRHGVRAGPLRVPNLSRLGLGAACRLASGRMPPGLGEPGPDAAWGAANEVSNGKDTPSGHWELAGLPVLFDWGYFPRTLPCFPAPLMDELKCRAGLPGTLGNRHASGTEIIAELGLQHMRSGAPICYTSADSVFQIAAHEQTFGLERLYEVCEIARELVQPWRIGRVIARPFVGGEATGFVRTANRRDWAVEPHGPTLLDIAAEAGRDVVSVGKIADIFAHRGTGRVLKGANHEELFGRTLEALEGLGAGGLALVNFVDFDGLYGHRRDVAGYAAALEAFDAMLPRLTAALRSGDMLVITADHGCDPTWAGSDHTRERVPVLVAAAGRCGTIGMRESFADIGATVARHLGLPATATGAPFWA